MKLFEKLLTIDAKYHLRYYYCLDVWVIERRRYLPNGRYMEITNCIKATRSTILCTDDEFEQQLVIARLAASELLPLRRHSAGYGEQQF